jgi:hypothetical protein
MPLLSFDVARMLNYSLNLRRKLSIVTASEHVGPSGKPETPFGGTVRCIKSNTGQSGDFWHTATGRCLPPPSGFYLASQGHSGVGSNRST